MKYRFLLWVNVLVISLIAVAVPQRSTSHFDATKLGKKTLHYTNIVRSTYGLPKVAWSAPLAAIAQEHARAMAEGQAPYDHTGSRERIAAFPGVVYAFAENLWMGNTPRSASQLPKEAVEGWKSSRGHFKNLKGDFTHCGIGVWQNAEGYWYCTQLFVKLRR